MQGTSKGVERTPPARHNKAISAMDKIEYCTLSDTQRMIWDDYRATLRDTKESMMNPITAWATPKYCKDLYLSVALRTIMLTEKRINTFRSQYAQVVMDFGAVIADMNDVYMSYAFSRMKENGYTHYTQIDGMSCRLHDIELQTLTQNNLMHTVDKDARNEKYQSLKQTWRKHYLSVFPKPLREKLNKIFLT